MTRSGRAGAVASSYARCVPRRPLRSALVLALALGPTLACAGLIGADFDRTLAPPDAASEGGVADDGAAGDDAAPPADARSDGKADSGPKPPPVDCGDRSGLQVGSPWPTEGGCNTRPGRTGAPALVKPSIAWRYTLPGSTAAFTSPPVVAADGTVYALAFDPPDAASLGYSLVAITPAGKERFRAPLPDGFGGAGAAPTLGADGTVYVAALGSLSAYTPAGSRKWAQSLGGTANGSSPTVLGDGTIVVSGAPKLEAFRPDGGSRWSYPNDGYAFVGTAAVTTAGLVVVGEQPPLGQLDGAVHVVSPDGQRRAKIAVTGTPITTPVLVDAQRFAVATNLSRYEVLTVGGAVDTLKAGPGLSDPLAPVAFTAPLVWFAGARSRPVTLDVATGAVTGRDDVAGITTAFASTADGSIVVGTRGGGNPNQVRGLSADGATQRWAVELEPTGADPKGPALGADGTVYLPWGATLYAVRD